jgi:hypothetical protein
MWFLWAENVNTRKIYESTPVLSHTTVYAYGWVENLKVLRKEAESVLGGHHLNICLD